MLGHSHISVTAAYQARKQKRLEAFVSFAKVMGIIGDEIEAGEGIDPRVLHARMLIGAEQRLDPDIRRRLNEGRLPRSRVGIPCSNPNDPPNLTEAKEKRHRCTLDLCVICRHGMVVDDAPGVFEAFARRLATLKIRLARMPLDAISGSLEDYESIRIREIVAAYYTHRADEFETLVRGFEKHGGLHGSE